MLRTLLEARDSVGFRATPKLQPESYGLQKTEITALKTNNSAQSLGFASNDTAFR
jgi:hypothetical protein